MPMSDVAFGHFPSFTRGQRVLTKPRILKWWKADYLIVTSTWQAADSVCCMFHAAGSEHLITRIVELIGEGLRSLQRLWDVLQHPAIRFSVAEIVYHVFNT
jgi:hypothetical protein